MTIKQIKELVNTPAYDFLRTDPHLGNRIMFLTLGGSHAYGTSTATSDVDIRGCTMNSASEIDEKFKDEIPSTKGMLV